MESKKAQLIETETRMVMARSWGVKREDIGQRYKIPLIR